MDSTQDLLDAAGQPPERPTAPRRRRRWRRRLLLVLLVLLVLTALASGGYQTSAATRAARKYPAPGGMFDVGGYKLHMRCVGAGPSVVLESGLGGWSVDWDIVQPEIAKFARVCSYDRGGLGWSDRGPGSSATRAGRARALHVLLGKAGLPPPYVIVGHSLGGIYAREFVARYPDEVGGLVFVDSSHEAMGSRMPRDEQTSVRRQILLLRFFRFLTPFGLQRAVDMPVANLEALDSHDAALAKELGFRSSSYFAMYDEASSLLAEDSRRTLRLRPVPPVPLVVLTSSENLIGASGKVWAALQTELVGLSPKGRQVIAERSGHFIQHDRPELVVQAIRETVASAAPAKEPVESSASAPQPSPSPEPSPSPAPTPAPDATGTPQPTPPSALTSPAP